MSNNILDVVTGKVRLSYVHLFTPYAAQQGQEPKYSTTILLPKSDITTKQKIDAAINAAIQQGVSKNWNGVRPPILAIPIHDGDGVRPSDGMPFNAECKGHWVFTASSKQKVEVVDINLNPIMDQTQVYSGIYARVSIRFYPFNTNGKKGVGCGLYPVQKLEDGEPLGGGVSAAEAFGGGAPAYPQLPYATPPQTAYQPQQPNYGQPTYGQPQQPNYGGQPAYIPPVAPQQPQYAPPIDPITGKPLVGGIYGL